MLKNVYVTYNLYSCVPNLNILSVPIQKVIMCQHSINLLYMYIIVKAQYVVKADNYHATPVLFFLVYVCIFKTTKIYGTTKTRWRLSNVKFSYQRICIALTVQLKEMLISLALRSILGCILMTLLCVVSG